MQLEKYQFTVELDKIYQLTRTPAFKAIQHYLINISIFVRGNGTVKVYTSENLPASKYDMQLEHTAIFGHKSFLTIPNYIYFEIDTGIIDEIIINGLLPIEVI